MWLYNQIISLLWYEEKWQFHTHLGFKQGFWKGQKYDSAQTFKHGDWRNKAQVTSSLIEKFDPAGGI